MQERRKSIRPPITATVKIIHRDKNFVHACARNINRGGIGIYSYSALEEGANVKLEIVFKDIRGKEIVETLHGRIEWQYKWNWIYVAGIKFHKLLNYAETPGLLEYIEYCEKLACGD